MSGVRRFVLVALTSVVLIACDDDDGITPDVTRFHELAIVELTFDNIGKPNMIASTIVHADTAVRFEALSVGFLDHPAKTGAGTRYIHALFRVRNAFRQVSGGFPVVVNLVAVGTTLTLPGTAFTALTTESGATLPTTFAEQVRATGRASFSEDGVVGVDSANVLRIFTEGERFQATLPGVTSVFNFGYVVTPAHPADSGEGIATVAFALPLLDVRTENPATLSVMLLVRLELL